MPPSMAACPARKAPCRSPGVSIRTPTARLIVEDEPLIAWSLADMIRTLGYEVSGTVATESAAVDGASGCDAVLMDFRLADGGSGHCRGAKDP